VGKDAVGDQVETVKGSVGGVVEGVQNATQRVGEALGKAQRAVGADAREVRAAARRGVGIAAENPVGFAVAAAVIGFLAGLLVPISQFERGTIGPIRDDFFERATNVSRNEPEVGKHVLADAATGPVDRSTSGVRGEYGTLLNG
jgi:hypothetical protein